MELRTVPAPIRLHLLLLLQLSSFVHSSSSVPFTATVRPLYESAWRQRAISAMREERSRMGHTPLFGLRIPGLKNATIMLKNETASASGTLKHRFVWSLVMWALSEGKITSSTTVYDSTSGNTGASEAYMCKLIGVPYVAVVSKNLEAEKRAQITQFNGKLMPVDTTLRNYHARKSAADSGGFFINQFGNAEAAEEYHESGYFAKESTNVYHEILAQLRAVSRPVPDYFVHSAGTGDTISSVGKYITRYNLPTSVVLADSQYSLFYDYVLSKKWGGASHGGGVCRTRYTTTRAGDAGRPAWRMPGIAGIGYGYNVDPIIYKNTTSLLRDVIDKVVRIPDIASVAAMRALRRELKVDAGVSTALNFLVALDTAITHERTVPISLVSIMGDPGKFYESTYHNDTWINQVFAGDGGMRALHCWYVEISRSIYRGTNFMTEGQTACKK